MKKIVSIMLMLALAICCMGITSFATNSSNHEQEINTLIEELSPFIEKNSNNHLFSNINDPRILGFIESLKPFFEDPKN